MNEKDRKIIYVSVIVSVLLHVIGLLLINGVDLFASSKQSQPEEPDPLELVFEQPEIPPEENLQNQPEEKFYEIVENPNASGETPETSDRLSTAASLSQAPAIIPGQIREVPGQETEEKSSSLEQSEQGNRELQEALEKSILAYKENRAFSKSALTGETTP